MFKTFMSLTKPRLNFMAVLSGLIAYLLSSKFITHNLNIEPNFYLRAETYLLQPWFSLIQSIHIFFVLYLFGGACNAMNQVMEHNLDKLMKRTANRPIPSGKISLRQAIFFSYLLLFLACFYSYYIFPLEVLLWGVITFCIYIYIYTPLKTKNAFNTIIGAIPGALPIILGWVATGASLKFPLVWFLFLIIFFWQLPHFFSLAYIYKNDYQKAGYKMITLYDESGKGIKILIFIGSLALIFSTFLPSLILAQTYDLGYFFIVFILNLILLFQSMSLFFNQNRIKAFFRYITIIYLPIVLLLIMFFF